PDFDNPLTKARLDLDIVADVLGADGKPVYKNATGTSPTTHGKKYFDWWYHDVAGANLRVDYPLPFVPNASGEYEYDSEGAGVAVVSDGGIKREFLPIDDDTDYATAFGNQGKPHNYSFTGELHTTFTYRGGESLRFRADDDLFVFIDRKLVVNLGGMH